MVQDQVHRLPQKTSQSFWQRVWQDSQGRTVIYQRPNIWIICWAIFEVMTSLGPGKRVADIASAVAMVFLVIWSLLEIFRGVNYFRRVLGMLVLLFAVWSRFAIF